MELTGESVIAADRARVWAALNDPAVLARCIDGVEALAATTGDDGQTRLDGTMNARVGPIRATFSGGVVLTEVDPPHRYVLIGEGKGGVAGFAKGRAEVTLTDAASDGAAGDGAATRLQYVVTSSVGGKLAQLGARLIEGTARGYADSFFTRLKTEVETPLPGAAPAVAATTADDAAEVSAPTAGDVAEAPVGIDQTVAASPAAATHPAPGDRDAQKLQGSRTATGLTPLVWASVVVLAVLIVLVWQLS